jgi:hypothetical protein
MAERRPFRVNEASPGTKGITDGEKAAPWPGNALHQAQRNGGPVPDPADLKAAGSHGHSPEIPWPTDAETAGKRPFKLGK